MSELTDKLDELMSKSSITRKVSQEKTEECPIWSSIDQLWLESDESLRKRLR